MPKHLVDHSQVKTTIINVANICTVEIVKTALIVQHNATSSKMNNPASSREEFTHEIKLIF